jgi:hypothetical protein
VWHLVCSIDREGKGVFMANERDQTRDEPLMGEMGDRPDRPGDEQVRDEPGAERLRGTGDDMEDEDEFEDTEDLEDEDEGEGTV